MKNTSHLENVSDRIIILICKEILKQTEEHNLDDRKFIRVCDEVSVKLFGDTMNHIDVDYMSKILEINPDILSKEMSLKLDSVKDFLRYFDKDFVILVNKKKHPYGGGLNRLLFLEKK